MLRTETVTTVKPLEINTEFSPIKIKLTQFDVSLCVIVRFPVMVCQCVCVCVSVSCVLLIINGTSSCLLGTILIITICQLRQRIVGTQEETWDVDTHTHTHTHTYACTHTHTDDEEQMNTFSCVFFLTVGGKSSLAFFFLDTFLIEWQKCFYSDFSISIWI